MARPGRKETLTPEISKRLCDLIRVGNFAQDAARACGVGPTTYYAWLAKGRLPRAKKMYRDFLSDINKAEAERTTSLVSTIRRASTQPKYWGAASWILKHTNQSFNAPVKLQIEGELKAAIAQLKKEFSNDPETLERALSALTGGPGLAGVAGNSEDQGAEGDQGGGDAGAVEAAQPAIGVPGTDV